MNSVTLIGRLTRDPELSYTQNTQTAVAKFTLAVDRPKKNGEDQGADFIRITVFGKQAESVDRYLSKGRQIAVQGRLQTGSYEKNGQKVFTTDVIADRVEFLGSSTSSSNGDNHMQIEHLSDEAVAAQMDDVPDTFQAAEDDIPF